MTGTASCAGGAPRGDRDAGRTARLRTVSAVGVGVVVALAVMQACASAGDSRYAAVPVGPDTTRSDRIEVDRPGVRITVGPPSQFPYTRRERDGADTARRATGAAGVYHLFTRVRVDNTGSDTVFVRWSGARLTTGGGRTIGLAAGVGTDAGAEAVPPGRSVVRGLLPASVDALEPGEPIVPLCDGCTYRLELPVRVGDVRHTFSFPFRLVAA